MIVILGKLAPHTVFMYRGMTLRKTCTVGPCDPETNRFKRDGLFGCACEPRLGGQFQADKDLQVWVPEKAEVIVKEALTK